MLSYTITNGILIFTSLVAVFINISIIRIHIKLPLLREGFFLVVFLQIITEFIINFSLLCLNIIYIIYEGEAPKIIFIFPILFNFGYIANMIYNIIILFFLLTYNKENEEQVSYEDSKEISDESLTRKSSVIIMTKSFNYFHIISFLIAITHTIFYILNLIEFQDIKIQTKGWRWYFYFICGRNYWYRILFFVFHFLFFIVSIIYLFKSCNKSKISDRIFLRSFALFSFFKSLFSMLFPAVLFIFWLGYDNDVEKLNQNYLLIIIFAFFGFLLISAFYRIKCYYISYILGNNEKDCLKKWKNAFNILFCCREIINLNFVDLNSNFIYHALSNTNDFILDEISETGVQLTSNSFGKN